MRLLRDELTVVGLLNSLKHSQTTVRRHAVRALGRTDLETSVALRQLGRALGDADSAVRVAAVQGLARYGSSALPLLRESLSSADRHVRREAVWSLARLGPEARDAVPALTEAVFDPDRRVGQGAIRALGNIGPDAADAIGQLADVVIGTNFVDARQAAWALARIGAPAVPALLHVVQTGDLYARCEAAWALGQIGPAVRDAVGVLTNLLDERGLTGTAKTPVLSETDGEDEPTATVLIRPRHGTEDAFWNMVVTALGEIGPGAVDAIPILVQLRQYSYGTMQVLAERALARIDPAA